MFGFSFKKYLANKLDTNLLYILPAYNLPNFYTFSKIPKWEV